jgi:hypothetical protein
MPLDMIYLITDLKLESPSRIAIQTLASLQLLNSLN